MDQDKMKGKMDDIKGRIKRQAGEWTGDEKLQNEGAADQVKGKIQNAWGNVKEGVRNMADDAREGADRMKHDAKREDRKMDRDDIDRKRDVA